MKHVCGEQGTGNREGREVEEEGEGKKEWGPKDCQWQDFHPQLQSDAVSRLSPQCPCQLRPRGLKREELTQRGDRSWNASCSMYLVRMRPSEFRVQVTCTSQTHNYRTFSVIWCQSHVSRTSLPFNKPRNITCLFTFRSRETQMFTQIRNGQSL